MVDITVREMTGGYVIMPVGPFEALEAGIVAATRIPYGQADAGDPPQPFPGSIIGYMISSEASSNFTLQFTVNATKDTGTTVTVNAAKENAVLPKADWVDFVAGDTLGMEVVADTTSKDFKGWLLVAHDTSGS